MNIIVNAVPENCSNITPCINNDDRDDAVWILTSSFIIFTMQSGFGLLESGIAAYKNEVNIMVKNVVDVVFGGMAFWMFGYGIGFGDGEWSNPFCGFGNFFFDGDHVEGRSAGSAYAAFFFQLSFSTTAGTIVSGAMVERTTLRSYIVFTCVNNIWYSFPGHWLWADNGFLKRMGALDNGGAAVVHLAGGCVGLVATLILKPRLGRFDKEYETQSMSSPTNMLLGTFMLWWGWLGFNCGSSWGVTNNKWHSSARAAVATIVSSMGGGVTATIFSFFLTKKCHVPMLVNGILAALVSITGMSGFARPWYSFIIGSIGSILATVAIPVMERLKIDDPVGVIPVHLLGGLWGMIAVGLFGEAPKYKVEHASQRVVDPPPKLAGLFFGGGMMLLGVQMLAIVIVVSWSMVTASISLLALKCSPIGLRMSKEHEELGADIVEHELNIDDVRETTETEQEPSGHKNLATVMEAASTWKRMATRLKDDNLAPRRHSTVQPIDAAAISNGHANTVETDDEGWARPSKQRRAESTRPNSGVHRRNSVSLSEI